MIKKRTTEQNWHEQSEAAKEEAAKLPYSAWWKWLDFSLSSTLLGHFLGTNSDLPLGVSKDRQFHGVVRCSTAKPSSSLRTSWPTFISASRLLAQIR
jgi:hypothetical protein